MTNLINLTLNLTEISHPIFIKASENSSKLLNYRLVSRLWKGQCDSLLKKMWQDLQDHPPRGGIDIPSMMRTIEASSRDKAENSLLIKFKKLADVFSKHRIKIANSFV